MRCWLQVLHWQQLLQLEGVENTYAYVSGNPVNIIDPLGLSDLNLFNPNDGSFHQRASLYQGQAGTYSVAGHGEPRFMLDANGYRVTPQDLAKMIQSDPKFKNDREVQLASCNTGRGENSFAQKLSDLLGKPVVAPTNFVYFRSDGSIYQGDADRNLNYVPGTIGLWWTYFPRNDP